ncbi:SAM-dependent methyltransferase [Haloferula sp.]|uniref:SAM-dependent methyltransferase n=1 Tax=Haloferula sp. TaxID=2497595 RepID=UPI003C75DCEB
MFPWTDPTQALRFDEFMAAALHDPARGYYARRIRGVGQSGDFTTTPGLTQVLGKAIAAWANHSLREENCHDLIELGPGEGALALTVLRSLPWHRRLRTHLHLVETSAPLRDKQESLLGKRVHWHQSIEDALEACDGRACIYSNEFVDAFPIRRFRKTGEQWEESFLLPQQEIWRTTEQLPASTIFEQNWQDAQVVEVHQSYHEWLDRTLPHWKQGRLLTIDYGARDRDLYHRQPMGSLRAYFHQTCLTGPEVRARPGHQDLTADVNFSDLIQWPAGDIAMVSLLSQSEFLAPFADRDDPADQFAIDPAGSGAAFLCLEQRRLH